MLAVTFTARAAGEMRTRLRALGVGGVQARTFHAAALRQLSYFWPQVVGGAPPAILEHKAGLVADAAARLRLSVDRAAVRDLAAEIEWAKVSLLTPSDLPGGPPRRARRGEPGGFDLATVARVLEVYEDVKTDRGVIDFEDVLLLTVGILEEYAEVAATIRGQYRHFVVDEYQDVSAAAAAPARPVARRPGRRLRRRRPEPDDLLVHRAPPRSTCSSFHGGIPGARVVRLVRDYRSTPQVVALANGLLAKAGRRRRPRRGPAPARRPATRRARPRG